MGVRFFDTYSRKNSLHVHLRDVSRVSRRHSHAKSYTAASFFFFVLLPLYNFWVLSFIEHFFFLSSFISGFIRHPLACTAMTYFRVAKTRLFFIFSLCFLLKFCTLTLGAFFLFLHFYIILLFATRRPYFLPYSLLSEATIFSFFFLFFFIILSSCSGRKRTLPTGRPVERSAILFFIRFFIAAFASSPIRTSP